MATILFADVNESALRTMMRAQELGHRTIIIGSESLQMYPKTDWVHRTLQEAARSVTVPITSDTDVMTKTLEDVCREETLDAVVAQLEASIEATAVACERLDIPFTRAEGVLNARNKDRTRDLIEAAGLASARHTVASDVANALEAAETIGYPVIAKPTSGTDSMFAYRADGPADLEDAAARILDAPAQVVTQLREQMDRGILIEEHLDGDLVSAELALLDGECTPLIMCGRSRGQANECIEMGAALPANLSAEDAEPCYAYAKAACEAVGLDFGVFHVELMLTEQGPVLVELNPRPMGGIMTTMYAQLTGREFSDYILDTYQRRPPKAQAFTGPQAITARKIIPVADGLLADGMDLGWVEAFDPRLISFHNYGLEAGQPVKAGQVLARYVVHADTWHETMDFADGLLDRFERDVGFTIHRSRPSTGRR